MNSRKSPARSAYTLIEVLVAMSILALGIGAASRLSLSQALTEELSLKETAASNYAENIARLWQLGIDTPDNYLLKTPNSIPNSDGSRNLMTWSIANNSDITGGEDNGNMALVVKQGTVSVNWIPPGKGSATTFSLTTLRGQPERR